MMIDQDYRKLGEIDPVLIQRAEERCRRIDWIVDGMRRTEGTLNRGRLCVLPYHVIIPDDPTLHQGLLYNGVFPIVQQVMQLFPDHVIMRGEMSTLPPRVSVVPHIDDGWMHQNSHRVHIPIYTNPLCKQMFETRSYHFSAGGIYEMNNRITHGAFNVGETVRVHLILDILPGKLFQYAGTPVESVRLVPHPVAGREVIQTDPDL